MKHPDIHLIIYRYLCHGENDYGIDVAILENLVLDKPQVNIDQVIAVGTDKIYFNWTVSDWNSPITDYFLSVSQFLYTFSQTYFKSVF